MAMTTHRVLDAIDNHWEHVQLVVDKMKDELLES